uniref:Uncharacterized protein n=1 Tax=Canis lupus dingo TaxID=286419 RepID=A0A8C0JLJ1_CANLU
MPNPTNSNRTIPSHTLHIRHSNSLFISHPYLPRRKLRLNYPIYTCKWSLHIFHLSIYTQRMGIILRLLRIHRNMKYWNYPPICNYSHGIHRLRLTMKTNIFLKSNCHHKLTFSNFLHWNKCS